MGNKIASYFLTFPGVNGSDICPVSAEALEDYAYASAPKLRYLRLDGNEIPPPIPRDIVTCFRLLRSIVI